MSMPKYQEELQALLSRYRTGKATESEASFIEQYDQLFDNQEKLTDRMTSAEQQAWKSFLSADMDKKLAEWRSKQPIPNKVIPIAKMIGWAAAIIIFIAGFWWISEQANTSEKPAMVINDVSPGKQRATLTLADGRKVVIEKNSSGLLALQGSIEIINDKGSLVYNGENASSAVQYHLLSTAKGEQSGVTLADGTVVYLDAATQIRYPVSFKGNERVVEILEGQAYFEVAHDGRPFYVKKGRQVVQVLGTVFNVMAYQFEQNMLVTLVSGKVNVNNGKRKVQIMPGSQAILSNSEESVVVNPRADVEQAVAWRHGQFAFHAVTLDVLLRQIERWYDVQVEVNGELPKGTFFYDGRRNGNLSELLRAFELNQIRYQLDAGKKKLIVNP